MISETKLDGSCPEGQFLIEGYHAPFRFSLNKNGGGIILYVSEDIPVKLLNHDSLLLTDFMLKLLPTKNDILNVFTIYIRLILMTIWS